MSSQGHTQLSTRRDGFFFLKLKVFILLALYHLLAPYGSSFNDSVSSKDYTLSYCSVDDAFAIVSSLGMGQV